MVEVVQAQASSRRENDPTIPAHNEEAKEEVNEGEEQNEHRRKNATYRAQPTKSPSSTRRPARADGVLAYYPGCAPSAF